MHLYVPIYGEREERHVVKTTITQKLEFWNIHKVAKLDAKLVNVYRAIKS